MKEKLDNSYILLCNALRLYAYNFDNLMAIDGPAFDVEFELSSEFETGLGLENIELLFSHDLISKEIKDAILDLREDLLDIPDSFWTVQELEGNIMWNKIRIKANAILDVMDIKNKNYDFSIETIL